GSGETEDPLLARGEPDVAVDESLFVPPLEVGGHLACDELAHRLAERLVVVVVQVTPHAGAPSGQPGRRPGRGWIGRCRAGRCSPGRETRGSVSPGPR